MANTAFARFVPSAYDDGISAPAGSTGALRRPDPRNISNLVRGAVPATVAAACIHSHISLVLHAVPCFAADLRSGSVPLHTLSVLFVHGRLSVCLCARSLLWRRLISLCRIDGVAQSAWGHFISNDLSQTLTNSQEPLPLPIPCCDPQLDPACLCNRTHPFFRAVFDPATGTNSSNPRAPLNAQTAFLDGSAVYGTSTARTALLRTFSGGKLLADAQNGLPLNAQSAPMDNPLPRVPLTAQRLAGDTRANISPGLLAIQGLMVLEHNRWCDVLSAANILLNDETLFQQVAAAVLPPRLSAGLLAHVDLT